jgi:hypothetical protein
MRNLRRALPLTLTAAMLISMMVPGASALPSFEKGAGVLWAHPLLFLNNDQSFSVSAQAAYRATFSSQSPRLSPWARM